MSTVRQRRIEKLLNLHGECAVDMLAGELGVSGMTVRRDLQALADAGRILRTHGGDSSPMRASARHTCGS